MDIEFECDLCQKKFANRDTLKRHFDVVHNMNKNFECTECGRKYRTKPGNTNIGYKLFKDSLKTEIDKRSNSLLKNGKRKEAKGR